MTHTEYISYGPPLSTRQQYTGRNHSATSMAQSYSQGSSTSSDSDSSRATYESHGFVESPGTVHMSQVYPDPNNYTPWSPPAITPPEASCLDFEVQAQKLYLCLVPGCQPKTKRGAFTRAADLDRHMQTVHNAAPTLLDCPYAKNWCERTGARGFSRKDHLNEHIRQVHPGKPEHRQRKADASTRAADLDRHMQTIHNATPAMLDCPYAKNWCERTGAHGFSQIDHLNDHIRDVHPGKRTFRQEKADAFTRAADLDKHMESDHNASPAMLDCPYAKNCCERTGERGFCLKDHLIEHIRKVHPGKPFFRQEKAGRR